MADRYLIGTGARNWTDPNIWSLTSGGVPYQPASGTEKITSAANREFSSDTGWWIKTGESTIGSGVANIKSTAGVLSSISVGMLLTIGKYYKITFTIVRSVSGNILFSDSFSFLSSGYSVVATYTIYGMASSTILSIKRSGITDIDIDNISVQEVDTIAPDATTSCIFDANSGTGTITVNSIANMLDFTCTNIGALTLANAAYAFNVFGSLTLHTNLTVTFTSTGYLYMKATDSRTITTNGKVANWNRLYFDGVGGTWMNQDDMNIVTTEGYLYNGIWSTNNKEITLGQFWGKNTTAKVLNLGSSTFRCAEWIIGLYTNFTLNAGTSTIICTSSYMYSRGLTYYNFQAITSGAFEIQGAATEIFNTFTLNTPNSINARLTLFCNLLTYNLTLTGSNATVNRLLISSNTIGTPRTITCNGTVTASNVDFRDITLAGTCNKDLSAITGGSGDCGGNSGIIFTTAQPQYFKKYASTANYGDAANWFSDLALTVAGRVPLPQDLGSKFLATSFNQTCTVSCNVPRIPCLDMSEVVNTVTWSLANAVEVYGSYVLGNNIIPSGASVTTLYGRSVFILNTYEKTLLGNIYIYGYGGTYTNMSTLNVPTKQIRTAYGIFDFNDFNSFAFNYYGGSHTGLVGDTVYFGSGVMTLYNNLTDHSFGSPSIIFCENSKIILSPASGSSIISISLGNKTYNKIQFSGSHTGNFDISGNNTIAELIIDSGRKVRFTAGTTQTIAKATIGAGATISSVTAATHTLNYTGSEEVVADGGITVTNSIATPAEKWFTGAGSTDGGGNSGWIFGTIDDAFTPKIMWID